MTEFDPERFAEEKYAAYFTELQQAYKRAFETMNEAYDSTLVHAIDQQVLNESEPWWAEREARSASGGASGEHRELRAGEFRIELPGNPHERVTGVAVSEEKLESVLDRYVEELRTELRREFGLE